MQTPLTVAILFLYGLCGVTVLGLAVLFLLKLVHVNAEKQSRRCLEKYRDYFGYLQAHGDEEERLKVPFGQVSQKEKRIIQKKLFELMGPIKGVHLQKLIWLCEDMGLVEFDQKRLSGAWKWTRVDAAYNLGVMRAKQAMPDLLSQLEKSKYDPSLFIIARAVAQCARDLADLRKMVLILVGHRKNCHQLIVDILSESDLDLAEFYVSLLRDPDTDVVKIGLIGSSVHVQPSMDPVLHKLVQSADKEVRIKALKLLCRNVRCLTPASVKSFMEHQDWEIRAIMAKELGTLQLHEHIPLLKKAVGDANWWVRNNSAHSLAELQVEGFHALLEILQEGRVGNKTEMAHQVVQIELEKGKKEQTDLEHQLQYNQKMHLYQKYSQKRIMTAHALER